MSRLSVLIALAISLAAQLAAAQGNDDRARLHFESGRSYFEEGNYELALVEFNSAYQLSRRAVLLVNVANCQERLGQWAEAANSLQTYLATLPANDPQRENLLRRVDNLHTRAANHEARPTSTVGGGGGGASDGLLVPSLIAFGVGGAALIMWGIFGGLALAEEGSIAGGCGATMSCSPEQVAGMDTLALVSDIMLVTGLVGAGVGALLLIIDPPHGGAAAPTARLLPFGGPSFGGLTLQGSF